jgi:hypothetical protein
MDNNLSRPVPKNQNGDKQPMRARSVAALRHRVSSLRAATPHYAPSDAR